MQTLDSDREGLIKMKKALKQIHQNGTNHVESEVLLSRALERLGNGSLSQEPELAAAFLKFAVVTKELSNLQRTLVRTLLISCCDTPLYFFYEKLNFAKFEI